MIKMEEKEMREQYVGEIYIDDLYAYANAYQSKYQYWEYDNGVIAGLKAHKNGYVFFCWQAALTESLWFVYRGMVKEAVIFDVITMVMAGVMLHFSNMAGLAVFLVMALVRGLLGIPMYYLHIKKAVEKRGLLRRSPLESKAARESLEKEGKPSKVRVVIYLLLKCFAAVCLDSILFSIFAMLATLSQ
ncbi:MAG: hypothetical protein II994_09515 [Lachnospiraceae bacterium]|nr:hypothetical protein [Lachnospiraceae bacterium]